MRIAQLAPLWETIPPETYGGTELVVANLSQELAKKGHQVTVFGVPHPDIQLEGVTVQCTVDKPLRKRDLTSQDAIYYELQFLEKIFSQAGDFDILHNHIGYQALPFASFCPTPMVTTLHGIFEPQPFKECIQSFHKLPYVSISDYQRKPCPNLNYVATVYHGIHANQYAYDLNPADKNYFAFLGRFSPEKGAQHAIRLALETGRPLIMAGKIVTEYQDYFAKEIEPYIDQKQICFIGEVNLAEKVELLKNAVATLCPIQWAEPFGLVLIESMACGTPVLTFKNGSTPEIIDDGVTGFIANSYEEMRAQADNISKLSRSACRKQVEERFSASRMADDYVQLYQQLISKKVLNPAFPKEKPALLSVKKQYATINSPQSFVGGVA